MPILPSPFIFSSFLPVSLLHQIPLHLFFFCSPPLFVPRSSSCCIFFCYLSFLYFVKFSFNFIYLLFSSSYFSTQIFGYKYPSLLLWKSEPFLPLLTPPLLFPLYSSFICAGLILFCSLFFSIIINCFYSMLFSYISSSNIFLQASSSFHIYLLPYIFSFLCSFSTLQMIFNNCFFCFFIFQFLSNLYWWIPFSSFPASLH